MEKQVIENLGDALYTAWTEKRTIDPLIETHPEIKIEDAYKIQERYIARRLQAGESIIGKKIGVTSKPVQDFLGVFEPDFGQLTSISVDAFRLTRNTLSLLRQIYYHLLNSGLRKFTLLLFAWRSAFATSSAYAISLR